MDQLSVVQAITQLMKELFNPTLFSQTTTLSVAAAANTEDVVYKCVITSNEWGETNRETSVALDVFCKL